jgi:drug/metabolite transporter (DMT)-like permease
VDEPSTILDYATPQPRLNRKEPVRPRRLLWAALCVTLASLVLPLDVGSGRVIVNPLRILGCFFAALCVVVYAFVRLWQERADGIFRNTVFAICIIAGSLSFAYAHWSVWGDNHKPRLGSDPQYWSALSFCAGSVLFAMIFDLSRWVVTRIGRRAARPAR